MTTQASFAARSGPSVTGRELKPPSAGRLPAPLEIVERHDPMRAETIENGYDDDRPASERPIDKEPAENAGEPGQGFVAETDEARPPPARAA